MGYTIEFGNGIFPTSQGSMAGTITDNDTGKVFNTALFCGRNSEKTGGTREGLLYTAKVFEPAINYIDGVAGLVTEPQRENLSEYANRFTSWSDSGRLIVTESDSQYEGNTVFRVDDALTTGSHRLFDNQSATQINSGDKFVATTKAKKGERFIFSVVLRNSAESVVTNEVVFDLDSLTVTGAGYIEEDNDGYYKCVSNLTATTTDTGYSWVYVRDSNGDSSYTGVSGYGFWLKTFQLEKGDMPTSLIITNGSTQTRLADTGFKTIDVSKWINESSFSLEVDLKRAFYTGIDSRLTLSDETTNNRVSLRFYDDSGSYKINPLVTSNGVAISNTFDTYDYDENRNIVKVVYTDTSLNVYLNDLIIVTKTHNNTMQKLTTLELASQAGNLPLFANIFNMKIES